MNGRTLSGIAAVLFGMRLCGVTAANQNKSQHDEYRRQTRECRMHSRISRLTSRTCGPACSSYAGFSFDEAAVISE